MANPQTPEEIYKTARAALLKQLASPAELETPQLGRVQYRPASDVAKGLALLDSQFAQPGMPGASKLYVIEHSRGIY